MAKRYTALVRGPAPVVPGDFIWVTLAWFAGLTGAVVLFGRLPLWYLPAALGGLLLAAVTWLSVALTMRSNAFAANSRGLLLGLRGGARRRLGRRRRQLYLPWEEIAQVVVVPRRYGTRAEIVLDPAGPAAQPASRGRRFAVVAVSVALPLAYLVRSPALLCPRRNPPRYRVRLWEVTPDAAGAVLSALAGPAGVPVRFSPRRPRWKSEVPPARPRPLPAAPQVLALPAGAPAGSGPAVTGPALGGQLAGAQGPGHDVAPLQQQPPQSRV